MEHKKILITGCNGFIGTNIMNYYLMRNYNVFGIGNHYSPISNKNFEFNLCNLEKDNLTDLYKKISPDIFIHCAGNASVGVSIENPELDFKKNVEILYKSLNAIDKSNTHPKFIFLSSAAVYGNPTKLPINEDDELNPISPYGLHKKMCEEICKYYIYNKKMDIKILRIFSAYGVGLKKQVIWEAINKFSLTQRIDLFGTGDETRDFVYIDDIVQLIEIICENNDNIRLYNAASGKETKIREVAEKIALIYGVDKSVINFSGEIKEGDPTNWRADISRIRNLGFKPKVGLESGLRKVIEWYNNGRICYEE